MDSSPRTPTRSTSQRRGATSTPSGSSASKRSRDDARTHAMDTSDMSEDLAQPLPVSPGPSTASTVVGGPPSEASSTSMLAPTPGAGNVYIN